MDVIFLLGKNSSLTPLILGDSVVALFPAGSLPWVLELSWIVSFVSLLYSARTEIILVSVFLLNYNVSFLKVRAWS